MPIKDYGVWKGAILEWFPTQKDNDHGHITFTDSSGRRLDSAINISSKDTDSRLVYWFDRSFQHRLVPKLDALEPGFHRIQGDLQGPGGLALDFFRDGLVEGNAGIIVSDSHDGGKDDILAYLDPILEQAVSAQAEIYLYGSQYTPKRDGIHDIHMNQGSSGSFRSQNGTWQDGAIILHFPSDDHWEAIFLAFASEASVTDDRGHPNGPLLSEVLQGETEVVTTGVYIQAALVNPVGPDGEPTKGPGETVYLVNTAINPVSVSGWTIGNGTGQKYQIEGDGRIAAQSKQAFSLPSTVSLSNKGGEIALRDNAGSVVDKVTYTKAQAQKEGKLLYFQPKR